jgi:putative spermidine/putrescine transport system substrate-binding protein
MNKLQAGSCAQYHLNAPAAYLKSIHFWKVPIATCGWGGRKDCVDFTAWQQAWTQITG